MASPARPIPPAALIQVMIQAALEMPRIIIKIDGAQIRPGLPILPRRLAGRPPSGQLAIPLAAQLAVGSTEL